MDYYLTAIGNVSVTKNNPIKPSAVVGSVRPWWDNNDATYATVWTSRVGDESGYTEYVDVASAAFDTGIPKPVTVQDFSLIIRAETFNTHLGYHPNPLRYEIWNTATGEMATSGEWSFYMIGEPEERTIPGAPEDRAAVAAALNAGACEVRISCVFQGNFATNDFGVNIAHARLYVVLGSARRVAPLRVLQRGSDGLGVTGGKRVLGSRTIQASNRALGIR